MKPKLLVILGTTSTGKTDLGLNLAKKLNGEIISADSRQVYKFLDLGTGKLPGKCETLEKFENHWKIDDIKIWMYDILNPEKRFNLYEYIIKANKQINEISKSKKLPIVVGGTGLYIRSLLEGITNFGIEENEELRKELELLSIEEIQKRINPETLKKLNESEQKNKRRLMRLVELSSEKSKPETYVGLEKNFNILKIGLKTDRKIIREKIKHRLISRISDGMIEESKKLLEKKILTFKRMEELGLEYKYLAKYLKGDIKTKEQLIEILSLKIGQFAKRQETWFKKEKNVNWIDISEKKFLEKVEKQILDWYNN